MPEKSLLKNSSNESANYSFGFFNPGFDLDAAINSGKQAEILANFNSLAHTKAVAHYESISENGVGETPYIIAYTGISDLPSTWADSPPWEIAVLTNSTFPKIPSGAEGTPTDYDITTLKYDLVLVGKETLGGGLDGGHLYSTEEMKEDEEAPVITLLGESPTTVYVGENYNDAGATATDEFAGDLTESILIAGAEIDTSTVGNYIVTYNVQDPAGNSAKEITRLVSVVQAPASRPAIKSLVVDGNKVTITLVTPDGVYDHWRVLISEESFNENLPLEGVIIKPGLEFTSPALASGTHQIHLAFADDKSLIIGESISTQVVILNTSGKKVQVTYGTASSGESGSIFSDSNGIGFSAGEPGIAAYGFFTPGYDIERGASRGDMNEMLSNFNPLAWSNFNDAISPGFFLKTVEHFENGVE